jgi:hypothetical protein
MLNEPSDGELTSMITTEHFTLQTARAAAIAQANGRANTYLGVLSSSLIALALVGQTTGLDRFFYLFGLLLFVPIAVLGLFTFERTMQLGLEDVSYATRINRLRRFYFRSSRVMDEYLIRPAESDDAVAVMEQSGVAHLRRLQGFTTTAGLIALVNGFLFAVLVGFMVQLAGADARVLIPLGAIVFLLSVAAQFRHAMRAWIRLHRALESKMRPRTDE